MCGIAGLLSTVGSVPCHDAVAQMINVLRHRGPDTCGIQVTTQSPSPVVVLGHTRLAILDLSSAGRQPMHSAGRRHAITYNGEIYNFRAVAARFPNASWRTRADTEVLLQAYAAWGRACVEELRGMFAFAIWDADRQELFLARDRLGIKPLYYARTDGGAFVFASEIRALLASGVLRPRIDPLALAQYLTYQSVPAPRTLVEGVRSLPPGCWLSVDATGQVREERYWDLLGGVGSRVEATTLAESRRQVADLLRQSVALHLVSDVPVGAFLSGGIDSTAVVALMREAGVVPRTFSVVFDEVAYDERAHARTVAKRFETDHTEIRLRERDLLDQIPDALDAMDQPTGDGINTYVVARAVRAAGITVALSGLGGDELFAGYPSFARLRRSATLFRAWGNVPPALRQVASHGVRVLGRSSVAASKAAAMAASDGRLAHLYPLLRQVLSLSQRQALLAQEWSEAARTEPDPYVRLLDEALGRRPAVSLLTAISFAEARTYMHDLLLRDTDQMSMAHSLEVRVPLLDHCLVEYVMRLPDARKQPAGLPKRLLVESLDGLLPESVVRRPKQGFALPFDPWLRGPLRQFCAERLGPEGLGGRGIFRPEALWAFWTAFLARRPDTTWSRVWVLVALEAWLDRNGF
ncbi:MAG TPA: asparagine synthase (glutamine-hydrolyzing) [Chloroflexota bacterium]|nr:asparagine synthase (glutamine-hydrolyzing) [Chloroflexota bacterium]